MRIFRPGRGFGPRLIESARRLKVSGARMFDLQIGLMAAEAGASEIWTHDAGFLAPSGLRVVDPIVA